MNWWKLANFDVQILESDAQEGTIVLSIAGKQPYVYKLRHPYFVSDVKRDLEKRQGTALSQYVRWLDRFLIQKPGSQKQVPKKKPSQLKLF